MKRKQRLTEFQRTSLLSTFLGLIAGVYLVSTDAYTTVSDYYINIAFVFGITFVFSYAVSISIGILNDWYAELGRTKNETIQTKVKVHHQGYRRHTNEAVRMYELQMRSEQAAARR